MEIIGDWSPQIDETAVFLPGSSVETIRFGSSSPMNFGPRLREDLIPES